VLENGRTATIQPIIAAKVKVGAQFFTDKDNIYHFTKADYDHRTVNNSAGEYARHDPDGTCVTATRWKAFGPACAIFRTASRVSANASFTSELHATTFCTSLPDLLA
jgi:hypothetical protein